MAEPELETSNHPTLRPLHRKPLTSNNDKSQHGAYIIKLTDTSLKALKNARKSDKPLRIKLEPGGTAGELVLGDQNFRFVGNDLLRDLGQGLMQAVNCKSGPNADYSDNEAANKWSVIEDTLRQRIVVKATDETFAETRQKALFLQEEEAKKAGKDITGSGKPKVKSKTRTIHSSSTQGTGARNKISGGGIGLGTKGGALSGYNSSSLSSKVSPPAGPLTHKSSNAGPPKTHSTGAYGSAGIGKGVDMSRRPIRDRVIHLLVLKSQTTAEVTDRLSKQVGGLADGDKKLIPIIMKEVGKPSSSLSAPPGTMSLNPAFYKDLDINYPFSSAFDKQKVRRALEGAKSSSSASGDAKSSQPQDYMPGSHRAATQPLRPPTGGGSKGHGASNAAMPLDSILPSGGDGNPRKRPTPPYSNPPSVSPPAPIKGGSSSHSPSNAETPANDVPKSKRSKYSDDSPSSSSADSSASSASSDSSVARSPTQGVAKLDIGGSPPPVPPDDPPTSPPPPPDADLPDKPPSRPSSKGSAIDRPTMDSRISAGSDPMTISLDSRNKAKDDEHHNRFIEDAHPPGKYRKSHQNQPTREARRERRDSGGNKETEGLQRSNSTSKSRRERPPPPLAPKNNKDYSMEFPEITSSDQRRKYKAAFEKDYDEYMHCYRQVKTVSKDFLRLDEKLKRADSGRELKKIEEEIFDKYESLQNDSAFRRTQAKHEDLRKKLAVIKERVRVWDDTLLAAGIMEPSSGDEDKPGEDMETEDTVPTPDPVLNGNKKKTSDSSRRKGRDKSPNPATKPTARTKDDDYENFSMF